jgi:hypothetical protein
VRLDATGILPASAPQTGISGSMTGKDGILHRNPALRRSFVAIGLRIVQRTGSIRDDVFHIVGGVCELPFSAAAKYAVNSGTNFTQLLSF